mgnify:CR=1 FL=1
MDPLEPNKPHLLVVVGLPGAGKTFFAKQFGETFGAPYVDYVHYHELTDNIDLGDTVATELLGQLFLTKRTIVVEGRGESKEDRAILMKLSAAKGYAILFVWVQTEPQTVLKRAVLSKDAPYSQSEFDSRSEAFDHLGRNEPHIVISGKHTYASQARMVLKRIAHPPKANDSSDKQVRDTRRPSIIKRSGRIIIS